MEFPRKVQRVPKGSIPKAEKTGSYLVRPDRGV